MSDYIVEPKESIVRQIPEPSLYNNKEIRALIEEMSELIERVNKLEKELKWYSIAIPLSSLVAFVYIGHIAHWI